MTFDGQALRALGGEPARPHRPATAAFLLRVGVAAALAASGCNLLLLLVAMWRGWSITPPDAPPVRPLGIVLVCLVVGVLAGSGAYVATRVTKRPALWVAAAGIGLLLASVQGLPGALQVMHVITGIWVIGWLNRAVVRGSHVR